MAPQRVRLSRHHDDPVRVPPAGNPERIPLAAQREHRGAACTARAQLGQPVLTRGRAPRRAQREGQRDHRAGADRPGRAAGHAGAVAPAALDQRDARDEPGQRGHDLDPRGVLAYGRPRGTRAPDPVGLRDARHHRAQLQPGVPHGQHVGRLDAAAGTVREHEQEPRPRALPVQVGERGPGGGLDLHYTFRSFLRNWPV
jgi:hypothetical protein